MSGVDAYVPPGGSDGRLALVLLPALLLLAAIGALVGVNSQRLRELSRSARELDELEDLRAYVRATIDCDATFIDSAHKFANYYAMTRDCPKSKDGVDLTVTAKGGAVMIEPDAPLVLGPFELRARCYGSKHEYRIEYRRRADSARAAASWVALFERPIPRLACSFPMDWLR